MHGFVFGHDLDDGAARGLVGRRDEKDAVEAAGPAEGGIEMPRGVGRAEDEQAVVVADVAVHLGEELVDERAAGALFEVVAVGSQGVHLVEKKHRRRVGAGELEKGVEVFFGVAEVEVEDLMDADGEKVRLDLPGGGAAEQGFAAARRAVKQHAAADFFAVSLEERRVLQRVDDLHPNLLFHGLHAADVGKVQRGPLDVGGTDGGLFLFVTFGRPALDRNLFRLGARWLGVAATGEFLFQTGVAQRGVEGQRLVVAGLRGRAVAFAGVEPGKQQVRGRKAGDVGEQRLDPHHGFAGFAGEVEHAGDAHFGLRPRGIEPLDALEKGARLIDRPLVQAGLGEEEEERDVFWRNGHGLAEWVELGHGRDSPAAGEG